MRIMLFFSLSCLTTTIIATQLVLSFLLMSYFSTVGIFNSLIDHINFYKTTIDVCSVRLLAIISKNKNYFTFF